jgi:hypothetical protein
MQTNQITPAEWARQAGLQNPNGIYNFLAGRTKSLSLETLTRLAIASGTTVGTLTGEGLGAIARGVRSVTIRMQAEVDRWRDGPELPVAEQATLPVPETVPASAFGVILGPGSLEGRYGPGSTAICVPMTTHRKALAAGDYVLVQRTRDDLTEVTVREVVADGPRLWLRIDARRPQHQLPPLALPADYQGQIWTEGNEQIQLVGVVRAIYVPLG